MSSYKVLGVSEDSSLEEIREAYEKKVNQINAEVINGKNADAFKKILDDAYSELIKDKKINNENTIVMSKDEFNKMLEEEQCNDEDCYYYDDDYDYYEDDDDYYEEEYKDEKYKTRNRKKRSSGNKRGRRNNRKGSRRSREDSDDYREYKKDYDLPGFISIPLKVLALPIIIILSIVLFIFDIINAALWAVTKILILGSVAVAAIHGYQIYSGICDIKYDVLAGCAGVFVLSIILPIIFKVIPKPLKIINNKLKAFVF